MAKEDPNKTKTYRFREGVGKHFHKVRDNDGKVTESRQLEPGDEVELTKAQFEAFGDKFEPVNVRGRNDDEDPNPRVTPTQPQRDGAKGAGASENSTNTVKT